MNIGNPEEISIKDLALKIKNKINTNIKLIYKKLPEDDPVKRKPNIDLAKLKYKWEPKISLNDGLENTIDYFKKFLL